jgi:hypothetical protein
LGVSSDVMTKHAFSALAEDLRPAFFSVALETRLPEMEETDSGNWVVRRARIFRVGEHTDSAGRVREWSHEDLDKAVQNFAYLKATSLPDIPLRIDHSISMRDVVGWILNVYRDDSEPDFLFCDWEFTEPDAAEKWRRRTFRGRSIEIGHYRTDEGNVLFPVVLGLAFVDIPAVGGLFRRPVASDQSAGGLAPSDAPPGNGPPSTDPHNHGGSMTKSNESQAQDGTPEAPTPHVFRVGGQEVSDYAAVQSHIASLESQVAALEAFRMETIEQGRRDFVKTLASQGKIANTQIDALSDLATTMTDEQFEAFRKGYESAPVSNLFGRHQTTPQGSPDEGQTDPVSEEIETLEEIVANHRRRGMPEDEIKTTKSFRRLMELKG